ncbi:hypothetical protein [Thermococcus sp.]|uniref:hypothetical protein n=1 Tax=Thermococcus sp. TaxID=35749 RepID=UPI0025D4748E|nr:hypothetical protein [Thermococcus sp.]
MWHTDNIDYCGKRFKPHLQVPVGLGLDNPYGKPIEKYREVRKASRPEVHRRPEDREEQGKDNRAKESFQN